MKKKPTVREKKKKKWSDGKKKEPEDKKNEKSDGKKKKKPSDDEKKPNRGKKWPYGKKKKKPEDPRTKRKSARRRGVQTRALTAPRSGRGPSCLRPVVAAGRGRGAPVAASASEDSQEESTARAGKPFGSGGRLSIGLFVDLSDDSDVQAVFSLGSRSRGEEEEINNNGMLPGAIAGVLEDGQGLLERGNWDVGAKR